MFHVSLCIVAEWMMVASWLIDNGSNLEENDVFLNFHVICVIL